MNWLYNKKVGEISRVFFYKKTWLHSFIHSCLPALYQDLVHKVVIMGFLEWREGLMQMKGHAEEKEGSKITKD